MAIETKQTKEEVVEEIVKDEVPVKKGKVVAIKDGFVVIENKKGEATAIPSVINKYKIGDIIEL